MNSASGSNVSGRGASGVWKTAFGRAASESWDGSSADGSRVCEPSAALEFGTIKAGRLDHERRLVAFCWPAKLLGSWSNRRLHSLQQK